MSNTTPLSTQDQRISSIVTPELTNFFKRCDHKMIRTLLMRLDPELSEERARYYEDQLVRCAQLWRHLALVDAAARAAIAIVTLESRAVEEHMLTASALLTEHASRSQQAYIIARAILNDDELLLDHLSPFDPSKELSVDNQARALYARFRLRSSWEFTCMTKEVARSLCRASELTPESWQNRVARLTKIYTQQKYPNAPSFST